MCVGILIIQPSLTPLKDRDVFGHGYLQASLTDDTQFSRTRDYTVTIDLLRLLLNSLVRFIESWESFADGEVQYFEVRNQETLRSIWETYLANVEKDMTELRFLRRVLDQMIEGLTNKRSGVSLVRD